ncbi:uncharacterized protein CIMG_11694 [Coccidioides immitis RS]|uniref:Uncharacterized protein n=1 Tax=Coccidioides immitis (strain RS) TaxID=246410 RepID=A0A0D8JW60_COCIM|nr:uncharacterized protein CIMG_11694 [Coccidioides immitis RS]KJF60523.1 hypothetical protein CIMG_11694 [Coccidioides immitis RS]
MANSGGDHSSRPFQPGCLPPIGSTRGMWGSLASTGRSKPCINHEDSAMRWKRLGHVGFKGPQTHNHAGSGVKGHEKSPDPRNLHQVSGSPVIDGHLGKRANRLGIFVVVLIGYLLTTTNYLAGLDFQKPGPKPQLNRGEIIETLPVDRLKGPGSNSQKSIKHSLLKRGNTDCNRSLALHRTLRVDPRPRFPRILTDAFFGRDVKQSNQFHEAAMNWRPRFSNPHFPYCKNINLSINHSSCSNFHIGSYIMFEQKFLQGYLIFE